ncbi:MAG TPA: TonB-dependent receptor [Thermoanaerobaculia bacterium]|nr:TonB-dependent receptor [Thermoanaerobaculia bacterium]
MARGRGGRSRGEADPQRHGGEPAGEHRRLLREEGAESLRRAGVALTGGYRLTRGAGKLLPYITWSLFLASFALAQTPTPTPDPAAAADLEEQITVTSRAAESATASTEVLDRDRVERSQAHDAAELVRSVAGVHLLGAGGLAGTSNALTRGGDANFTLVLLDGIPLNDATDVQGGAFDLSTLDVDAIDSVEVLRGPHSHFFGSSAVAGAINLVTRDGGAGTDGSLRLDAGEDSLLHAGASISGPIGTARTQPTPGADDTGSDGARAGAGFFVGAQLDRERHAVAEDSYEQLTVHGSSTFDIGAAAALRVTGRAAEIDLEDYPEGSGGPVFGSGELRDTEGEQLSLGLGWAVHAGDWLHRGSATANRSRQDVASPAIEFSVPASVEDRDYTRAQLSWIADHDLTHRIGISLGAQLDRERGESESTLFLPPFLGGDIVGDYRLSRTTPGAFAAAAVDIGPLVVEAGLRADDPESLDVEWSPRLGVRWAIADSGWQVRSSWSRAFKLPSFFALASPPALGGNPALEPETSNGADAGVEYVRNGNRLGLTLFRSTYHDLIDFDFEQFLHVNRSSVEAEGVELTGRLRPVESLLVFAALTLQDVESPTAANVALHSPDHFGNLGIEWSPLEPLLLRVEARYASDTEDVQIPVPDRTEVEGWTVVDLAASWRLANAFTLRARLDNATDEEYEQFVGFPQPGRRARVGVQYDFR